MARAAVNFIKSKRKRPAQPRRRHHRGLIGVEHQNTTAPARQDTTRSGWAYSHARDEEEITKSGLSWMGLRPETNISNVTSSKQSLSLADRKQRLLQCSDWGLFHPNERHQHQNDAKQYQNQLDDYTADDISSNTFSQDMRAELEMSDAETVFESTSIDIDVNSDIEYEHLTRSPSTVNVYLSSSPPHRFEYEGAESANDVHIAGAVDGAQTLFSAYDDLLFRAHHRLNKLSFLHPCMYEDVGFPYEYEPVLSALMPPNLQDHETGWPFEIIMNREQC